MAKAYYDPTVRFGIVERPSFYAYQVDVPERAIKQAVALRRLHDEIEVNEQHAALPNQAQELADNVAAEMHKIMRTRKVNNDTDSK